jgi:hypothetical protein
MAIVRFSSHLHRHLELPGEVQAGGANVRSTLDEVFATAPKLAGYVLDDQRSLRQHVVVFVDGQMIRDRKLLTDAVGPASEVYVMQALSGG